MRLLLVPPALALVACGASSIAFPPDGGDWPAAVIPDSSRRERLVITDDGDDTLAIVSTEATPALLGFAPAGVNPVQLEGPHHLAASPDGRTLYVNLSNYAPGSGAGPHGPVGTGRDPGNLLVVDAATYRAIGVVPLDRDPGEVILSRDGKTAWVSHYDLVKLEDALTRGLPEPDGFSTVATIDTATLAPPALLPVCATAHGLAASTDEKKLFVACSVADQIAIVDLATHAVTRLPVGPGAGAIGQPVYFPYAVSVAPADGSVWLSCNGASGAQGWPGLRVFEPSTGKMADARALRLPGVPMFGDFLPDGATLVVPQQGIERVSFIDTRTSQEVGAIDLPPATCLKAHMVRVSADGNFGWVSCEGDHVSRRGTLVTLDLQARAVIGFVEVGLYADGIVRVPATAH